MHTCVSTPLVAEIEMSKKNVLRVTVTFTNLVGTFFVFFVLFWGGSKGAVGDCWFLAGLAVISERPDLISRVVGGNGHLADDSGCFEVNLFKDGRWER